MHDVPEPISVTQAAKILGCSRRFVHQLINKGELLFKRQGNRFMVDRCEIERMAASGWERVGTLAVVHKSKVRVVK
jgi:excisionase family DNA binding protein